MIDKDAIRQAIDAARAEREALQPQLMALRDVLQRSKQLEDFIRYGRQLLGELPSPLITDASPRKRSRSKQTTEICIVELFEEQQRPMRVAEIAHVLRERNLVRGRWATEVVRNALNRSEQFERIAPGIYVMTQWPDTLKRWDPTERLSIT